MQKHTKTFVPIRAWVFNSPEVVKKYKQLIDAGLFCEALLYYEKVTVNISNIKDLVDFITWFKNQNKIEELIKLINDGTIDFYIYAFDSVVVEKNGTCSLWNMQTPSQKEPFSFIKECLENAEFKKMINEIKQKDEIITLLKSHITEVKSDEYAEAVENSRKDAISANTSEVILQTLLNELYPIHNLGKAPLVKTIMERKDDIFRIKYNLNIDLVAKNFDMQLSFNRNVVMIGAHLRNRYILSASKLQSDLYLGSPMSELVGDKLHETTSKYLKKEHVIQELISEVEYPSIGKLVNDGILGISDILEIRQKAKKFRKWLNDEGEKDRNAILAYHNEVAKESNLVKFGGSTLKLFGIFGGAIAGEAVGGIGGAMAGAGLGYLVDIASKIEDGWRPVVFGEWLKDRMIKKHKRS